MTSFIMADEISKNLASLQALMLTILISYTSCISFITLWFTSFWLDVNVDLFRYFLSLCDILAWLMAVAINCDSWIQEENVSRRWKWLFCIDDERWWAIWREICTKNMMMSFPFSTLLALFAGNQGIPLTKTSDAELWCFLWLNSWVNYDEPGDLRCHCANYDITVMKCFHHVSYNMLSWLIGHWEKWG